MLAASLAALIILGYAGALWWLLRRESSATLLALLTLCGISLALRLLYTGDFPGGLDEDEPKTFACVAISLSVGRVFGPDCTGLPALLTALFQSQLIPILGVGFWPMRLYPMVMSVLATPAAFAAARAWGLRIAPSLAVGGFIAVLPWSIFYGRIDLGGELTFHQLLLLAALARLVRGRGGWPEVAIGGFGLSLLFYDYWAGRAMLGMPFVAAILARGRYRFLCLLVAVVALIGWAPDLTRDTGGAFMASHVDTTYAQQGIEALRAKIFHYGNAFIAADGQDGFFTIRSGARHPWIILACAVLGILVPSRRSLFFIAGFLGGLAPSLIAEGAHGNAHRMMMAFPFIALAAGCPLDWLPRRSWRVVAAAAVFLVTAVQSVALYFSPEFWPPQSRERFDWETSALVEALPLSGHPPLVVQRLIGYYFNPHALVDPNYEYLSVENWYPFDGPSLYGFTGRTADLIPFYEDLFGVERVQRFGNAFLLRLEKGDWSWIQEHGWSYEAHCGDDAWFGHVPTLFFYLFDFRDFGCALAAEHVWHGRWDGPPLTLRLVFSGEATVETSTGVHVAQHGFETFVDFNVEPDAEVTIGVKTPPQSAGVTAILYELTRAGTVLPPWDYATPIDDDAS